MTFDEALEIDQALEIVKLVVDSLYFQGHLSETDRRQIPQDDKQEIALEIVEKLKNE